MRKVFLRKMMIIYKMNEKICCLNRVKLDDNLKFLEFIEKFEVVCVGIVEFGKMMKDFVFIIYGLK